MQSLSGKALLVLGTLVVGLAFLANPGMSQKPRALQGVDTVKALFDVRSGDPGFLYSHLHLVYTTYKDQMVRNSDESPQFAVVFMSRSVVPLSRNRDQFSAEERETLDQMDDLLVKMDKAGITLEVCEVALGSQNVDLDSIPSEVDSVRNGWVSSIGYQAKGYSLVPVY
jgi:intracellular sulfur oxidation DsrE/DsrF family protein